MKNEKTKKSKNKMAKKISEVTPEVMDELQQEHDVFLEESREAEEVAIANTYDDEYTREYYKTLVPIEDNIDEDDDPVVDEWPENFPAFEQLPPIHQIVARHVPNWLIPQAMLALDSIQCLHCANFAGIYHENFNSKKDIEYPGIYGFVLAQPSTGKGELLKLFEPFLVKYKKLRDKADAEQEEFEREYHRRGGKTASELPTPHNRLLPEEMTAPALFKYMKNCKSLNEFLLETEFGRIISQRDWPAFNVNFLKGYHGEELSRSAASLESVKGTVKCRMACLCTCPPHVFSKAIKDVMDGLLTRCSVEEIVGKHRNLNITPFTADEILEINRYLDWCWDHTYKTDPYGNLDVKPVTMIPAYYNTALYYSAKQWLDMAFKNEKPSWWMFATRRGLEMFRIGISLFTEYAYQGITITNDIYHTQIKPYLNAHADRGIHWLYANFGTRADEKILVGRLGEKLPFAKLYDALPDTFNETMLEEAKTKLQVKTRTRMVKHQWKKRLAIFEQTINGEVIYMKDPLGGSESAAIDTPQPSPS